MAVTKGRHQTFQSSWELVNTFLILGVSADDDFTVVYRAPRILLSCETESLEKLLEYIEFEKAFSWSG